VVPARLRAELALEVGDELIASADDGRLVFEPRSVVASRARARFGGVRTSLAAELAREREEEARLEAAR